MTFGPKASSPSLALTSVPLTEVDVDQAKDVAAHFSISAMPTFVIVQSGRKVAEMKGADPSGLEALVRKHAPASAASGSGSAPVEKGLEGFVSVWSLSDRDCADSPMPDLQSSLNGSIDQQQVSCLNEDASHTIRDLLKGGGDKWLESDADEQLLLHIPVRLVPLSRGAGHCKLTPSTYRPSSRSRSALSASTPFPARLHKHRRSSVCSSILPQLSASTMPSRSSQRRSSSSPKRRQRARRPFNFASCASRMSPH